MVTLDNAHALLVGISRYESVNSLPKTVENDASEISRVLIDPNLGTYDPGNVSLLLSEEASRDRIEEWFLNTARDIDEDAIVFIYFSGHGARNDVDETSYLLPFDADVSTDELLVHTGITGQELASWLEAIAARKLMLVLDCCHAAGLSKAAHPAGNLTIGIHTNELERLGAGIGRAVLSSSRATEESWVNEGAPNSVFTQHLVRGIEGGIATDDGLIRVFDLFEYAQTNTVKDQPNQHPVFRAELESNFPVVMRQAGTAKSAETDDEGFEYDAFVSYVDAGADADWVWNYLVPDLEAAGLRIAVSGDVEVPGVSRVTNAERGIRRSRRTIVVLSDRYMTDTMAGFQNELAQSMGIDEGTYRLLPVQFSTIGAEIPPRIQMLTRLDFTDDGRKDRQKARLVQTLRQPLVER